MTGRASRLDVLRGTSAWRAATVARGLLLGGERGREAWVELRRPRNLFQPFGHTEPDRYPEVFDVVEGLLATSAPRLLSFGCSTGEEVLSLWRRWPQATVRGLDINPRTVRVAQEALARAGVPARVGVACGGDAGREAENAYDAVFAMAVFRHGRLNHGPPTCRPLLRFADFDRTLTGLVRTVRPGGLLVLRHANFRLADSAAAAVLVRLTGPGEMWERASPIYGPDDRLAPGQHHDDGIYRRVG